jgi:hypothetical protein
MRVFFSIVIIVIWQSVLSQTIDLSSENSIREFLNDKEIKVGEYGAVQFTY